MKPSNQGINQFQSSSVSSAGVMPNNHNHHLHPHHHPHFNPNNFPMHHHFAAAGSLLTPSENRYSFESVSNRLSDDEENDDNDDEDDNDEDINVSDDIGQNDENTSTSKTKSRSRSNSPNLKSFKSSFPLTKRQKLESISPKSTASSSLLSVTSHQNPAFSSFQPNQLPPPPSAPPAGLFNPFASLEQPNSTRFNPFVGLFPPLLPTLNPKPQITKAKKCDISNIESLIESKTSSLHTNEENVSSTRPIDPGLALSTSTSDMGSVSSSSSVTASPFKPGTEQINPLMNPEFLQSFANPSSLPMLYFYAALNNQHHQNASPEFASFLAANKLDSSSPSSSSSPIERFKSSSPRSSHRTQPYPTPSGLKTKSYKLNLSSESSESGSCADEKKECDEEEVEENLNESYNTDSNKRSEHKITVDEANTSKESCVKEEEDRDDDECDSNNESSFGYTTENDQK